MTTTARQAEADRASVAFQVALTQIGAGTAQEAMKLWAEVPTTGRGPVVSAWLRRAITLVMTRRRMSRDLARAYYRLARALQTGTTVADPYHPEPTYITLDVLRQEFAALAGGQPEPPQEGGSQAPSNRHPDTRREAVSEPLSGGDEMVRVEVLGGLRESEDPIETAAEQEATIVLEALGPTNLDRKVSNVDTGQPADQVDSLREEVHLQVGAQQAAAAARVAMNGGRSAIWNHAGRDRRVLGYVRLSRTGTPCGWCAMLISRGFVRKDRYRTQAAAGPSLADLESGEYEDGDKYHDNCQCYAEPVWSEEQATKSSRFDMSRQYAEEWPAVTRGLSGRAAVSAWRRHIRSQQKANAQAAGPTSSVQEA